MSSSDDEKFWGEGEDSHGYQAFDFDGEGANDLSQFYSGSGEFDDSDEDNAYGDFDMDEDDEVSEDDSTPLSITDRLAKQLSILKSSGDDNHQGDLDSAQSLFSSLQSASKKSTNSSSKQDKATAIRKQLLQYQQQLKIRLFLQQPQGNFEQLPLDPTIFVKLSTINMEDNGKLLLQEPDSDDEHMKEIGTAAATRNLVNNTNISIGLDDNDDYALLKKGSKIRKLDCILNQPYVEQHSFQVSSQIPPGTIPFDVNNVANVDMVNQFYKHPMVKKMKLSQAITAQTLGDLIKLERGIAKGSGALPYDENNLENSAIHSSSNLSSTQLLDDTFEKCIQQNIVLRGLTAKQTADLINESTQANQSILEELDQDNINASDDEKLDNNDRANILLSNYQEYYDNIETYLDLLFNSSMSKVNKTLDKWDKRTNSSLASSIAGGADLSALSIPLSQQVSTTVHTEQKRLVQKSRLRRFALNSFCIDPQVKKQLLLALSDLGETAVAAQERFDSDIYDDFDFTSTLLQDVNTSLIDYSSSSNALSLSFKQLQQQQDAIAKQLKQTTFHAQHGILRHSKKKNVQINVVVPKAVNFTLPRLDISWIRANGLELDNHSELDSDGALRDSVDPLLGTTTTDAMFVDNLLLHLFGTQQRRVSKYVEQLQQQQQIQKDKEQAEKEKELLEHYDNNSDLENEDEDDDDDDYEAEFGGSDMGNWFKK